MTAEIVEIRQVVRLECSRCGASAEGSCGCGEPYLPAKRRAIDAIEANPEKSDRSIAVDLGISPTTVGKARAETVHDGQLRVGADGKTRRRPIRETEDPENFVTAYLLKVDATVRLADEAAWLIEGKATKEIAAAARQAAAAWSELATKLENQL